MLCAEQDWVQGLFSLDPSKLAVVQSLSHIRLFVTQWTVTHQAPLSMRFPGQEYWELPIPSQGDVTNPGINPPLLNHRWILYH